MVIKESCWRKVECSPQDAYYKLANIITEGYGSILLCGDRGVGKTKLVKKIENDLKGKTVFIWLNTLRLNALTDPDNQSIGMLFILKFLLEELSRLPLPERSTIRNLKRDLYTTEKIVSNRLTFSTSEKDGTAGAVDASIQTKWLGFTTMQLSSTLTNYFIRTGENTYPSRLATFFGGIGKIFNLKAHAINLWNYLAGERNQSIVFVFDELDDIKNPDDVLMLVKKFKNLFTLTKPSFLFITDPRILPKVTWLGSSLVAKEDGYEDKFRTLFSDVIFLERHSVPVLLEYLEKITIFKTKRKSVKIQWMKYMIIKAKGNIFNLKRYLSTNTKHVGKTLKFEFGALKSSHIKIIVDAFNVGELVISNIKDIVEREVLYTLLYQYMEDFDSYLQNISTEGRKKAEDIRSAVKSCNNNYREIIDRFGKEIAETYSSIITGKSSGINLLDTEGYILWGELVNSAPKFKNILDLRNGSLITPLEWDFDAKLRAANSKCQEIFNQGNIFQSSNITLHGILTEENLSAIRAAKDELSKRLKDRKVELFERSTTLLNDSIAKMERFWNFSSGIQLRMDSPNVKYDREKHLIIMEPSTDIASIGTIATRLYIHRLKGSNANNFEFDFNISFNDEKSSLYAVLHQNEKLEYSNNESLCIVRVTPYRPVDNGNRSGIILKLSGAPVSKNTFVNSTSLPRQLPIHETIYVRIQYKKNQLILFTKLENEKKFSKMDQLALPKGQGLYHLVLSNDIGEVVVNDITKNQVSKSNKK